MYIPHNTTGPKHANLPKYIQNTINYRQKLFPFTNYSQVKQKFVAVSKKLSKMITKFYCNRESKIISNQHSLFSYIRNHAKKPLSFPSITMPDNHIAVSNAEKASAFRDHFMSVYNQLQSSLTSNRVNLTPSQDCLFDYSLMFLTENHVFLDLELLPKTQNTTPDGIPNIILKKCANSLKLPISYILRYSFLHGIVPTKWKESIIIPLHKSGPKSNPNNYRPISLCSSVSKIAERCFLAEISSFLYNHNVIPPTQYGFVPKSSVVSQLIETIDDWTKALDNGYLVDIVYFDFAKAFDSINHDLLLQKLCNYGLTGNCIKWLSSYLNNRTFRVKINNSLSESAISKCGVPQGSVIAPFLFNVFIADLPTKFVLKTVAIKQFADDLKAYIIYKKNDEISAHNDLQKFINHVTTWSSTSLLKLSITKCKILHLGRNNSHNPYTILNQPLNVVVDHIRDLGLLVTPDLKWKVHIRNICLTALRRWFNILRVIKSTNYTVLRQIYVSYVRPKLEFPSQVFNTNAVGLSNLLENVQRKITRHIIFRHTGKEVTMSYENRLKLLKLDLLKVRRLKLDIIYYHKIMHGEINIKHANEHVPDMADTNSNSTAKTRLQHRRIKILGSRLQIRHNSYFVRLPKIYSKIPSKWTSINDSSAFKRFVNNSNMFQNIVDNLL